MKAFLVKHFKVIVVGLAIIAAMLILCGCSGTYKFEDRYDLVQISLNNQTEGRLSGIFLLVTGEIRDESKFTFYLKRKDGGIKLKNIDYWNATIFEDSETPYVDYYYNNVTGQVLWEFHVPKNSIYNKIDLDIPKK